MKKLVLLLLSVLTFTIIQSEPGLIGDVLSLPGRAVETTGEAIAGTGRALSGRPYYYDDYYGPYYGRPSYRRYYDGRVVRVVPERTVIVPAQRLQRTVPIVRDCQVYYNQLNSEFNAAVNANNKARIALVQSKVDSYMASPDYQHCPEMTKQQFEQLSVDINDALNQAAVMPAM